MIPFVGKPYDKLVEKAQGVRFMAKVFTMPDVEVGSIIEYRYVIRYADEYFYAPNWYIQSNLFTRKAHYLWKPTEKELITNDDRGQLTSSVAWTPILPVGTTLKETHLPPVAYHNSRLLLEVDVHDVPPVPREDFMPPIDSLSFRVLFYYTPYRSGEEFWKSEGKHWAKLRDKFIGPGPGVTAAVRDLTIPTDTQDQKLRKLYAAVMKLENTSFTREHSSSEEKAEGFREAHTTDDIWARKRGNDDQLTALFVAMARAAGMKAYLAGVTSRDRNIFLKAYSNLSQLNDDIAIVNVDGKDRYFDPGSRFCPYGHLAWKHTFVQGLRQTDSGSDFVQTGGESYQFSRTQRVANLTLDAQGQVTGTIKMTYMGYPGLHWRQRSLEGDATSLERQIRTNVEQLVPQGIELKVASIENVADYEQPLVVNLDVKGTLGSSTGKRLLVPGDLFESNEKPSFPQEKREVPVAFEYTRYNQDAVRINFPQALTIESLPANGNINFKTFVVFAVKTESTPASFTYRRDFALGEVLFLTKEYPELRSFYSKMEDKDQESVVLTTAKSAAPKSAPTGN